MIHFKRLISGLTLKLTLIPFIPFLYINVIAQNLHLVNYDKNQYNGNHKNWSASQDERGVMYFANDAGILEFDGIEWRLNKLINNLSVISVAVRSHELIFSGGREEFGRWDRDISGKLVYTSLSKLIKEENLRNDDFWKIYITPECVYFQSFNSIYVYDYETVRRINSDMAFLFLSQIGEDFWIQQMRGSLYKINKSDFLHIPGSEIFWQTDVRIILPYQENKLLIGTSNKGIYIYDGSGFHEWNNTFSNKVKIEDLNCGIFTSRNTYVWGTIVNGIYETDEDGNIINHISSKNNLQNNTVLGLYEDHAQDIWVLLDKGISRIKYMKNMSSYIDYTGHIGSIYDAKIWNDKLFLGTNQGVFYANMQDLILTNNLSAMRFVNGTQGQTWSLFIDHNRLIACNNKGLIEIDNTLRAYDIHAIKTGVFQLKEINYKQRNFFFASTYLGLRIITKNSGIVFRSIMLDEPIKNVEIDHLNNIWIEHLFKGVYKCKIKDDFSDYQSIEFFGGEEDGNLPYKLKIFKVGGRILLFGDNRFFVYDDIKNEIIPNEELDRTLGHIKNIVQIIHINDIHYWVIADNVIYKFRYDGTEASVYESYDLRANNFSMLEYDANISVLNDSINLICLDNGFLIYNKPTDSDLEKKRGLDTPYLASFMISDINNNKKFISPSAADKEIQNTFNTVEIGFGANNTLSGDVFFQYKLIGVDNEWTIPRQINSVSYVRLSHGKYSLQIRTTNQLGVMSEVLSVDFEILPPWYQSTQAYLFYFILVVFIVFCIWYMIKRYYKKQHIRKIRKWESQQLKLKNQQLQDEIEKKNAELFTQTSFLIKKNEIILKLRDIVENFYAKNQIKSLIPLQQSINSYLNKNVNSDEDWEMFLIKFEEKHTAFFKKMKSLYPDLNKYDLRLCACLKLNLDTKEIASLMNLSVRGVESSRYRLRKKLNIEQSQNLNEFILTID